MATRLYPAFRKRIDDAIDHLIETQVTPWSFMTAGPPFSIKTFIGKEIAYEGIGFEGSPSNVFWGRYIEPFLEDLCVKEVSAAVSHAQERGVDAKVLLPEVEGLLLAGFRRVFERMADVDRRLRGKGTPSSVQPQQTERYYQAMKAFAEERVRAELETWKPKPTEASKEPVSRKLLWSVIGSVVAIGVGATYAWLTGVLDPPRVKISVEEFLEQPGSPTYDSDGLSHVTDANVKIKNTWSQGLKNVEVRVSIVPRDKGNEPLSVSVDPKCQRVESSGPDFLGFYTAVMRCEFLAPSEEVWVNLGFPHTRISGLQIAVRSPEREQKIEHIFDRETPKKKT